MKEGHEEHNFPQQFTDPSKGPDSSRQWRHMREETTHRIRIALNRGAQNFSNGGPTIFSRQVAGVEFRLGAKFNFNSIYILQG